MRFGLLAVLALALASPGAALAQSLGDIGGSASAFSVSLSPQYPVPYGTATLSFLSSNTDLTNATLSVSAGGKNIYRGAVQPVTLALGKAGSTLSVTVTISANGASDTQSLTIQPQDVALVAEPLSSAPVLYPGKPLVPLEGSVRVVAMANLRSAGGKPLDPSALSYAWTVDGTQIANSSGIGKQTVLVASPLQYRARDVSVAVMSQDGVQVGGASLSLTAEEPLVRIYENDPLLGIRFDHALFGQYAISGTESSLYGAPYSFPAAGNIPFLQWFLNGDAAQTGNSITLRPTGSGQGSASLSFVASSGSYTTAAADLSVSFGATQSSNIFGL